MDIRDFFKSSAPILANNTYSANTFDKIKELAEYLQKMLPEIEKEYKLLELKQLEKPNKVFPIKMEALAHIFNGAESLYEWYIKNAK